MKMILPCFYQSNFNRFKSHCLSKRSGSRLNFDRFKSLIETKYRAKLQLIICDTITIKIDVLMCIRRIINTLSYELVYLASRHYHLMTCSCSKLIAMITIIIVFKRAREYASTHLRGRHLHSYVCFHQLSCYDNRIWKQFLVT